LRDAELVVDDVAVGSALWDGIGVPSVALDVVAGSCVGSAVSDGKRNVDVLLSSETLDVVSGGKVVLALDSTEAVSDA